MPPYSAWSLGPSQARCHLARGRAGNSRGRAKHVLNFFSTQGEAPFDCIVSYEDPTHPVANLNRDGFPLGNRLGHRDSDREIFRIHPVPQHSQPESAPAFETRTAAVIEIKLETNLP